MSERPKLEELIDAAPPADPLSEQTRKERLWLLLTSLLAFGLTWGGMAPTEIDAVGVALSEVQQGSILAILALVVAYFLGAFVIYAIPDLRHTRARDQLFRQHLASYARPTAEQLKATRTSESFEGLAAAGQVLDDLRMADGLRGGRIARLLFDFVLPLVVALIAEALLLAAALDRPVFDWHALHRSTGVWITAVVLLAGLGYVLARGLLPAARKRNEPLNRVKEATKQMAALSEEMRRAAALPKDSKQREEAKRRIEEKLKALAKPKGGEPPAP